MVSLGEFLNLDMKTLGRYAPLNIRYMERNNLPSCLNYENLDIARENGREVNRIAYTEEVNYCVIILRKKTKYTRGYSKLYAHSCIMPPILVPSSAKRIVTQILIIAKLNERLLN